MNFGIHARNWRLLPMTCGAYGHTLNHRQVFSPTGRYAYYDTRNADPDIVITDRVERIDLDTLDVETLYRTRHAGQFGPGVGAVVCHPYVERLLFIHGLENCDAERPYSAFRRFGALLNVSAEARVIQHAESRCIETPLVWGSLRGGTHAHSWSSDGMAASFTYNDAVVEARHRQSQGPVDRRTVGVMRCDHSTSVNREDDENFSGRCWSMIAAAVCDRPRPGSDELESAREECWLGSRHDAIVYIGRVHALDGRNVDEVFLSEWPADMEYPIGSASVDDSGRLVPPPCVSTRRLTHTTDRNFPGIDGPRNWLLTSHDGAYVFCTLRDDQGIVQLFSVEVSSGRLRQLTQLNSSIENQLAIDPSRQWISLVSNGRIGVVNLASLECIWLPEVRNEVVAVPSAVHFLPNGNGFLFHAIPRHSSNSWQQLWTLSVH